MRILVILVIAGAVVTAVVLLAAYSYGRFSEHALGPPSSALPLGTGTELDGAIAPLTAAEAGKSGLEMIPDSIDAFAARTLTARAAGRSLDLMYYIWEYDLTGRLLAAEVLAAADRGVRVRVIIDDATTHGNVIPYLSLASHPNIDVRLFNPTQARDNALRRGFEMAARFFTTTRRMHNKAWVADGRLAIVGGRNIGDDYFDASESSNFSDLDVVMLGPAVQETETIFDRFWNSRVVLPIEAIAGTRKPNLDQMRAQLAATAGSAEAAPYLRRVDDRVSAAAMVSEIGGLHWTDTAEVLSDPPEKALDEQRENWLLATLAPVMQSAERYLEITSPYFVPGDPGERFLLDLARRGVDVSVLTNGLAATDPFPLAFSHYAGYRAPLLAGGIHIYELAPQLKPVDTSLFGSGTLGLHAKNFSVDDRSGFIGSFNFDPRSAALNTEMGVLFDQPDLVAEMRELFARKTAPGASFSLTLDDGALAWNGEKDGTTTVFDRDPETGPFRRGLTWLLGWLPVQSQL